MPEWERWTDPLTGSDLEANSSIGVPPRPAPICWVVGPEQPGDAPIVALWVRRAITKDPLVEAWVRDHLPGMLATTDTGAEPDTAEQIEKLLSAQFAAEGGVEVTEAVIAEAAEAFARQLAQVPVRPTIRRLLPNGVQIDAVASETVARAPVTTLIYPADSGVASMLVLRDGSLGHLAELSDRLARRYLVPASEVLRCILTGALPRLTSVRLGVRFRQFEVDGVPVTATSRVVLEVDPQLDAAELARTFVHWQKAEGVETPRSSPKLVSLASELVGRLRLVPADRLTDSGSHPAELFDVGAKPWRLVPVQPWARLAHQVNYDPRLIRSRAAAIVHLLLPLNSPHEPRWLPRYPVRTG